MNSRTLNEWCADNRVPRSTFYLEKGRGGMPDLIKVGRRILITDEADADWKARMLAAAKDASHSTEASDA